MELLKFAVPGLTALLGLVKLLNIPGRALKLLTTLLIILSGAGSAALIGQSGKAEARRAVAAEEAQRRAEDKLNRMSDALLGIQQNLAELQVQLARAPQGSPGSASARTALAATLKRVSDAKLIANPAEPPAESSETPAAPVSPAVGTPDSDDR
ncbi:MAG: hypothetical protein R6X12_05795 [bacterium]